MAALTTSIKSFIVETLIDSLQSVNPTSWAASTQYSAGTQVSSNRAVYICLSPGTSGSAAPAGTGIVSDGGCSWAYVYSFRSATSIDSNLYLGIGRTQEWDNDTAPPAEDTSDAGKKAVKDDLITLLKISQSNARAGLHTNPWTTATVYDSYAGVSGSISTYVTTASGDVYKCLDNNSGAASTVQPTGQSVTPFVTSDGYVWKYMATANVSDIAEFGTSDYIPVSIATDIGSPQYNVQQAASSGEISSFEAPYTEVGTGTIATYVRVLESFNSTGAVVTPEEESVVTVASESGEPTHVYTTSPGSGYGNYTWVVLSDSAATDGECHAYATVAAGAVVSGTVDTAGSAYPDGALAVIVGDGSGATADVVLDDSSKTVNSITITAGGSGYTWANIIIVPGSVAWTARAILSPAGGHGANVVTELGASAILFSASVTGVLSPYIPATFTYRQLSLVAGVSPVKGYEQNKLAYIGPQNPLWAAGVYDSSAPAKYDEASGQVVYINNYTPVNHTTSNEEIIKISISF